MFVNKDFLPLFLDCTTVSSSNYCWILLSNYNIILVLPLAWYGFCIDLFISAVENIGVETVYIKSTAVAYTNVIKHCMRRQRKYVYIYCITATVAWHAILGARGCFTNVSRALQNILSKFFYCPNHCSNAPITPVRALVPILDFVQIVRQRP